MTSYYASNEAKKLLGFRAGWKPASLAVVRIVLGCIGRAKHDKFASIGFDKYCEIVAVNGRRVASAAMRAPPSMVSRASFGGAIKPRRPVTEPLMLRIHFRFRGMADMAGFAVGSTRSRMDPTETLTNVSMP
jgi:hypothetical protein